jgi:diaminopimelate epimerase
MTGSGNDFAFVDGRVHAPDTWDASRIQQICDRRNGLGADGFAVLERGSSTGRVRFHFFNSDGSRAPMCGNGALCATRVAMWLELVDSPEMVLETLAGDVNTRALDGPEQRSELSIEITPELRELDIDLADGERSVHFTTVGVPHVVVRVDDVRSVHLMKRGRALRQHPAVGPAGSNVNFVSPSEDTNHWVMRTYERGVEAETMACGTGAAACACVLVRSGEVSLPWHVGTASARVLTISGDLSEDGHLSNPRIAGEGRLVYRAILAS